MGYFLDWTNPEMPRIRDAPDGEDLDIVADVFIRHHLEMINAHSKAIESMLNDVIQS